MHIGRYEVVRELGRGGQGRVYEAVLAGPGGFTRRVALKVMPDGVVLEREARLGGLLRHPHLVDVYEVGEHDGSWFLAMEYCPDGTLAGRPPLPPRAVVDVGLQVCDALHYAHEELGLVHLDLKPQNLLLDGARVLVADLGIATARGVEGSGRVEGTRGYMAPERVRGAAVDARADVWSLGVVLQELATGRVTAGATLSADEPTLPGDAPVDPAEWLAPVLDRCLAPDPDDRFPSMAEVAQALRALPAAGPRLAELLAPATRSGTPGPVASAEVPFVGRADEIDALLARLGAPGVLTLRGPAGVGKTRLATELARRRAAATGTGTWFADLSEVPSRAGLVALVASALGVPAGTASDEALERTLCDALAARGDGLVVLDGFDRLTDHADLIERLVERAPRIRLLVTSRRALHLPGEAVVDVGPLDDLDGIALVRAVAVRRGVELAADVDVAGLVRRLDGLPLALELAAGRLGVLSLAEVTERLSLSLLRSGRAGAADRVATLRGALQWSWDLLRESEQSALAQLSVFRGGFSLEAADAVLELPEGGSALDAVAALVERSLVAVRDGRFALLEPVRQFAAEHLRDVVAVERRHAAWFATLRAKVVPDVRDLENVVSACRSAARRGDAVDAVATLEGAWPLVDRRGPLSLALELVDAVRACVLTPAHVAVVERVHGVVLGRVGRYSEARERLEAALALARTASDRRAEANCLLVLGSLLAGPLRSEEGVAFLEEALAAQRAVGNRLGEGRVLGALAYAAIDRGQLDEARERYATALEIQREAGDRRSEALTLDNLGAVHMTAGDGASARACFDRALVLDRELGDRRLQASVDGHLASLAFDEGRLAEAEGAYRRALGALESIGDRPEVARLLGNLGELYRATGRLDDAARTLEAARDRLRELGLRRSEALVLINLGALHADAGRPEQARAALDEALVIARPAGDRFAVASALLVLGTQQLGDGAVAAARATAAEALAQVRTLPHRRLEPSANELVAEVCEAEGALVEARIHARAALALQDRMRDPAGAASLHALVAALEAGGGAPGTAREHADAAVVKVRVVAEPLVRARVWCRLAEAEHRLGAGAAALAALAEAERVAVEVRVGPESPVGRRIAAVREQIARAPAR